MKRVLRAVAYTLVGAATTYLLGKLALAATGLHCHCFWNDPIVALKTGAVGGLFFSFIHQPKLFHEQAS